MLKIAWRSVAANKIRFALTALAIVLGVGFISSANILSDGLRASFASLSEEINQGIDLQVESAQDAPLTVEQVDEINDIDGVRTAIGGFSSDSGEVLPIRNDGSVVLPEGPPVVTFGWIEDAQLNNSTIVDGRAPEAANEWVIDVDSAADEGFVVGESYDFVVPTGDGTGRAELVGTFRFGEENQTNGAVLLAFEQTFTGELLGETNFGGIVVAIDGSEGLPEVKEAVELALGDDFVVQDTAELNAETAADFNAFIDVFAWFLRGFAIVALFVSIFIIANTFNIVMSQRVRELGLLRAIGATPGQVRRAVFGEALFVGVIASIIGLFVGLGLAIGVEVFLNAVGAELPEFSKSLSATTVIVGLAVGVIVTLLSAWVPARKAGLIAPITAISGHDGLDSRVGRRSIIFGALFAIGGAVLTGAALFGGIENAGPLFALLGSGAALLFIGVTMLSPLVAAPIARTVGAPIRLLFRRPGLLATENAARNPKRTATTAAALMIGLSLVSLAFVVGETLKNDTDELLATTVQADFAAIPNSAALVPEAMVADLEAAPEIGSVTPVKYWDTPFSFEAIASAAPGEGESATENVEMFYEVGTLPLDRIDDSFDLGLVAGSYADIADSSMALRENVAEELGVSIGDSAVVTLEDGTTVDLEVVAIFTDGNIFSGAIVTEARWDTIGTQDTFDWVAASVADGATIEEANAAVMEIAADYPQLTTQNAAEFREEVSGQIDQLLFTLSGLLGLAILIAFIGIVNTMALSIFERTRELGLLRAVGMTRGQMGRMVRWEAAIVSTVGAVLGAIIGIVFGALVVIAAPAEFLNQLSIPWVSLGVLVIIAALAGLVAGFLPARRAGKLNVLDAIAS